MFKVGAHRSNMVRPLFEYLYRYSIKTMKLQLIHIDPMTVETEEVRTVIKEGSLAYLMGFAGAHYNQPNICLRFEFGEFHYGFFYGEGEFHSYGVIYGFN